MKDNKSFIVKILIIVAFIILIIGLIWLGFTAVKMVDKWIARKAKAEVAQKAFGGIGGMLPRPSIGK